ncbi:uncharacterized protein LOC144877436 [Branchiostoma floridae x Branchiostoma japonicum]
MIHASTFTNLPRLRILYLSFNNITMIQKGTFANQPRLEVLRLRGKQIKMIESDSFASLIQVKELWLSYNQITGIQPGTFANLPQLQQLLLSYNQIAMIQEGLFANLPQLQELYLHSNQTMIHASTFANLLRLQNLNLATNQITMIQPCKFAKLPDLRRLDLRYNKLSAISPLAFGLLPSNFVIQLNGNPWQCDCKMVPFKKNTTEFPTFKDQLICAQPLKIRGKKLIDVNPEEFVCAVPIISALPVYLQVTCNNVYNGTTSGSTTGPAFKQNKTGARISSTLQTTSGRPESDSSEESVPSFPTPVLIGSVCGSIAGIALIGTVILTIWCKRRNKNPPPNSSSPPIPNMSVAEVSSGKDHQYEDIDQHNRTGQSQSQANPRPLNADNLSHNVLAALNPNPMYRGAGAQSKVLAALDPNPMYVGVGASAAVVASGHDLHYEDVDKDNQTGQGQSDVITESNTHTTATV